MTEIKITELGNIYDLYTNIRRNLILTKKENSFANAKDFLTSDIASKHNIKELSVLWTLYKHVYYKVLTMDVKMNDPQKCILVFQKYYKKYLNNELNINIDMEEVSIETILDKKNNQKNEIVNIERKNNNNIDNEKLDYLYDYYTNIRKTLVMKNKKTNFNNARFLFEDILLNQFELREIELFWDIYIHVYYNVLTLDTKLKNIAKSKEVYRDYYRKYINNEASIKFNSNIVLPKNIINAAIVVENNKNKEEVVIVEEQTDVFDYENPKLSNNNVLNVSVESIYSLLIKTTLLFGYEDVFKTVDKLLVMYNYNHNIQNTKLDFIFSIFIEVNYYNLYFINDYNKFIRLSNNNLIKFKEKIKTLNKSQNLYNRIQLIPKSNDKLMFINLFEGNEYDYLTQINIISVSDLKTLGYKDIHKMLTLDYLDFNLEENVEFLEKDYKIKINNYLDLVLSNTLKNNEYDILKMRAFNEILENIGKKYSVTRERIRQIEKRAKFKIKDLGMNLYKYLLLISKDRYFVSVDVLSQYIENHIDVFLFVNELYFKESNLVGLSSKSKFKFDCVFEAIENNESFIFIDNLDDFLTDISEKNNVYFKNTENIFYSLYFKEGKYFSKNKLSLGDKYLIIIKNHFNDERTIHLNMIPQFKNAYYEVFEDDEIFSRDDRAVFVRLIDSDYMILTEKGTYKYIEDISNGVSEEVYQDMYKFIQSEENLFVGYLYEVFKDKIYPNIKSRFELHGILKNKFKDIYFTKDYVGISMNPFVDVDQILNNYIKETQGIVSLDKLHLDIPKLEGAHISQYMSENENFLSMFNRMYIHKDYFRITKEDIALLKYQINQLFNLNDIINGSTILQIMKDYTPNIVIDNNITSNVYAFHVFRVFLNDDCELIYPNIIKSNTKFENISFYEENRFVVDEVFRNNQIRINDIRKLASEAKINITNMKEYLEYFYKNGYIRINENMIAKTNMVINANAIRMVERIEKTLLGLNNKSYKIKISELNFDILPKEIKWNNHLLAHLLINESTIIKVETVGNQYTNLDYILEVII